MQSRRRRVLFLSEKEDKISLKQASRLVQTYIEDGCSSFVCRFLYEADFQLIRAIKDWKEKRRDCQLELIFFDAPPLLTRKEEHELMHGCDEFCFIDNISKDKVAQMSYLKRRVTEVCIANQALERQG